MTRRQQQRARRAALLALHPRRFVMVNVQEREAARAAVMAEMRRQAEEFSWRKPATPSPLKSAGFPAVNGNGHAGAIYC
jgi:hypothetical protein